MNEVERGQVWKEKRGAAAVIVSGFDEDKSNVHYVIRDTGFVKVQYLYDFLWEFQKTDQKAKLSYEG